MRHRVVVRSSFRPWHRGLWVALAVFALALGGYATWRIARNDGFRVGAGSSDVEHLRDERRRLMRELRSARDELAALQGRSTFEARGREIDAQTCDALRASVTDLETQVADLREQLAFYRTFAAPDQARAGVRVLRIDLRPGEAERTWRYELVLVQPMHRDRTAGGRYELAVEGLQDKRMRTLAMPDLGMSAEGSNAFSFRSFQEFEGEIRIPPGFLPSRLTVTLSVQEAGAASHSVSESFDWTRLASVSKES